MLGQDYPTFFMELEVQTSGDHKPPMSLNSTDGCAAGTGSSSTKQAIFKDSTARCTVSLFQILFEAFANCLTERYSSLPIPERTSHEEKPSTSSFHSTTPNNYYRFFTLLSSTFSLTTVTRGNST
jgi:hypothetical protein